MAVRIRMKKMGRAHRPFFRLCAVDGRSPRDGRVLEELGTYDPMIRDLNARAVLKGDRIDYWVSVGAQPSEKCSVLIKKYGTDGTHAEQQKVALDQLAAQRGQASVRASQAATMAPVAVAEESAPAPEAPAQEAPAPEAPAPEAPAAE